MDLNSSAANGLKSSSEEGTVATGHLDTPSYLSTDGVHATGVIVDQGQGLKKFQELLKKFASWQGGCAEATECHDLNVHLCECECIITEAKLGDHETVQRVCHILCNLLYQHTPGEITRGSRLQSFKWVNNISLSFFPTSRDGGA